MACSVRCVVVPGVSLFTLRHPCVMASVRALFVSSARCGDSKQTQTKFKTETKQSCIQLSVEPHVRLFYLHAMNWESIVFAHRDQATDMRSITWHWTNYARIVLIRIKQHTMTFFTSLLKELETYKSAWYIIDFIEPILWVFIWSCSGEMQSQRQFNVRIGPTQSQHTFCARCWKLRTGRLSWVPLVWLNRTKDEIATTGWLHCVQLECFRSGNE